MRGGVVVVMVLRGSLVRGLEIQLFCGIYRVIIMFEKH